MRVFLLIVSLIWVALGAAIVLYTDRMRNALKGYLQEADVRVLACSALVTGIIFLVGAFKVEEIFGIALFLGVLAMVKGVCFLTVPAPRVRAVMEWWYDRAGETTIRLWGLISFTLGVVLLSRLV